jgi:hypothetical protein
VGLDAFVYCRCWQDGIAAPPPCAPELVGLDEDGWLGLLLPYEGNEAAYWAVYDWVHSGCVHKEMQYASEHVSNWSGYRSFQDALRHAGPSHFRTLLAELPDTNDGQTSAEAAARALADLDYFAEHARLDDLVVLIDEATGDVLIEYIEAYQGEKILDRGHRVGVDPDGFFVRDPRTDPATTVFRSMRFRQRPVGEDRVEFTDESGAPLGNGRRVVEVAISPIGSHREKELPQRLRVETRPQTAADFGYITGPLRAIFRASVEIGNPVRWT